MLSAIQFVDKELADRSVQEEKKARKKEKKKEKKVSTFFLRSNLFSNTCIYRCTVVCYINNCRRDSNIQASLFSILRAAMQICNTMANPLVSSLQEKKKLQRLQRKAGKGQGGIPGAHQRRELVHAEHTV